MTTTTCPICKREHEVYRLIDSGGKSKLCFTCKSVSAQSTDKTGRPIFVHITKELPFTGEVSGEPRERWTPKYSKEQQGKQQHQLLLMTS